MQILAFGQFDLGICLCFLISCQITKRMSETTERIFEMAEKLDSRTQFHLESKDMSSGVSSSRAKYFASLCVSLATTLIVTFGVVAIITRYI